MAWKTRETAKTTAHTCGGPVFGRLATRGTCRRCDELRFGAPAVRWSCQDAAKRQAETLAAIRAHDCVARRCGPVCTAFDW